MKVEYVDHLGTDLSVVNAARVSFSKVSETLEEKDEKLIKYLANHKHWTPFAHTAITLRITAPIPIRTQCFKHKQGFVENEVSRRYVSYTPEVFKPVWRHSNRNKKQGSSGKMEGTRLIQEIYDESVEKAIEAYILLIGFGVCEEQARFVLPQGVYTQWVWTGSLAAYARFYSLRSKEDAQLEIQELAKQIGGIIKPLFPVSWEALTNE